MYGMFYRRDKEHIAVLIVVYLETVKNKTVVFLWYFWVNPKK